MRDRSFDVAPPGRIGQWAEQCLDAGLVSIHFVNVIARPIVAPFGGRDARLGTNPFCVGVPRAGRDGVVLELRDQPHRAGQDARRLQPGPARRTRHAARRPRRAHHRSAVHRGRAGRRAAAVRRAQGRRPRLRCELLGGALAGGPTGRTPADGQRRVWNGMFSIVVDPVRLGTSEHLAREVEAYAAWHTASPPREGVDRVRVPGDVERETKAARLVDGIAVDATTWAGSSRPAVASASTGTGSSRSPEVTGRMVAPLSCSP